MLLDARKLLVSVWFFLSCSGLISNCWININSSWHSFSYLHSSHQNFWNNLNVIRYKLTWHLTFRFSYFVDEFFKYVWKQKWYYQKHIGIFVKQKFCMYSGYMCSIHAILDARIPAKRVFTFLYNSIETHRICSNWSLEI